VVLFARRSELATLRLGDVVETPDGLLVTIGQSKTDQDAVGETVAIPPGRREQTCPVRLMRAWRALVVDQGSTTRVSGRCSRRRPRGSYR
jgi:hypothetical protein